MEWKYKIWLMLGGAALTVFLAWTWSTYIAIGLTVLYAILFPLTIKKQFFDKQKK